RTREQAPHERRALGLGEVDRDRALVAIGAQVVPALRRLHAARVAQERRAPRARLVADAGPLYLDHVRAEGARPLRAGRPGKPAAFTRASSRITISADSTWMPMWST